MAKESILLWKEGLELGFLGAGVEGCTGHQRLGPWTQQCFSINLESTWTLDLWDGNPSVCRERAGGRARGQLWQTGLSDPLLEALVGTARLLSWCLTLEMVKWGGGQPHPGSW